MEFKKIGPQLVKINPGTEICEREEARKVSPKNLKFIIHR